MGFKGFVNSDSGITLTQTYGVESLTSIQRFALLIKAGTDAIGAELAPEYIVSAVEFGLLDKADLDRANINRATALFKQGRFENPYLTTNRLTSCAPPTWKPLMTRRILST